MSIVNQWWNPNNNYPITVDPDVGSVRLDWFVKGSSQFLQYTTDNEFAYVNLSGIKSRSSLDAVEDSQSLQVNRAWELRTFKIDISVNGHK